MTDTSIATCETVYICFSVRGWYLSVSARSKKVHIDGAAPRLAYKRSVGVTYSIHSFITSNESDRKEEVPVGLVNVVGRECIIMLTDVIFEPEAQRTYIKRMQHACWQYQILDIVH